MMFLFKKGTLKRQDGEEGVNVALDVAYAPFFPGPYFGRNVIENGSSGQVFLDERCYFQVEAGVVHQDNHVGPDMADKVLALRHSSQQ